MDYLQPDFYRFSDDSLYLIRAALQKIKEKSKSKSKLRSALELESKKEVKRALDLGAGCGIVGIEAMIKSQNEIPLSSRYHFDFCEIQESFHPYLQKNLENFQQNFFSYPATIHPCSFSQLREREEEKEKYDLILSNPPYFEPHRNLLSPQNPQKNICRFFLREASSEFFRTLVFCLKKDGAIYFNWREGQVDLSPLRQNPKLVITEVARHKSVAILEVTYK